MYKLMLGDCLNRMDEIKDKSIDMVMVDPPYGTTACKWDSIISLKPMWEQLKRIIKPNGAIAMTSSQPYTSKLVMSNVKMFRYEWVWNKKLAGNTILAKKHPLKIHENILIFSFAGNIFYAPKMRQGKFRMKGFKSALSKIYGSSKSTDTRIWNDLYYPQSILEVTNANNRIGRVHPTQKPVALMEYLIKTYTNEGETVLDFCMGSGTTGVACLNLDRDFIGIEKNRKIYGTAVKRIKEAKQQRKSRFF